MARVLIIGAGGVGRVTTHACAWASTVFDEIHLASRRIESCREISTDVDPSIDIHQVDASESENVLNLLERVRPDIVINTALPEHNLPIMDACLKAGSHYLDTSAPEPEEGQYELFAYRWQWDYDARFRDRGLTAVLSCGFDPGVTNIFTSFAARHLFDCIDSVDILDCNAGNHGHAFATNFNPVTNIQEVIQPAYYRKGCDWVEIDPFSERIEYEFPEIGTRPMYLLYHEELESLCRFFPEVKIWRFWMGFSEQYLTHLRVLQNVGMTSMQPVRHRGLEIVPLKLLKELLPNPASLGATYRGRTCIGCLIEGERNGEPRRTFIYNLCDHQEAYRKTGSQAISFTTGIPAMLGALLVMEGPWRRAGVYNVEQFDPLPFLELIGEYGLPWAKTDSPAVI